MSPTKGWSSRSTRIVRFDRGEGASLSFFPYDRAAMEAASIPMTPKR